MRYCACLPLVAASLLLTLYVAPVRAQEFPIGAYGTHVLDTYAADLYNWPDLNALGLTWWIPDSRVYSDSGSTLLNALLPVAEINDVKIWVPYREMATFSRAISVIYEVEDHEYATVDPRATKRVDPQAHIPEFANVGDETYQGVVTAVAERPEVPLVIASSFRTAYNYAFVRSSNMYVTVAMKVDVPPDPQSNVLSVKFIQDPDDDSTTTIITDSKITWLKYVSSPTCPESIEFRCVTFSAHTSAIQNVLSWLLYEIT